MSIRSEKFKNCKHKHVQDYSEVCLDCGENIYSTVAEINQEENRKERSKREHDDFDKNDSGW